MPAHERKDPQRIGPGPPSVTPTLGEQLLLLSLDDESGTAKSRRLRQNCKAGND